MAAAKSKLPPNGRTGYDGVMRYPVQIFLTAETITKAEAKAASRVWPSCRSRAAVCARIVEDSLKK